MLFRSTDGLDNILTVYAIGNPAKKNRKGRLETLHDKASGYGVVRMNKAKGTITMECHRLLIDAANLKPNDQFPGWPKTISHEENYGRAAVSHLPEIKVKGLEHPVIQVTDAQTGELIYALRIRGDSIRPKVFNLKAKYNLRIGEPDLNQWKTLKGLSPVKSGDKSSLSVSF